METKTKRINPKVKARIDAVKSDILKKKILVVGGGIAGLHFAKLMADHSPVGADNITIVEKYPKGKVKLCAEGLINYARNFDVVPDEFLEIPFCDVTLRVGGAATRLSDNVPLITTYNKTGFLEYEADLIRDAGGTVILDRKVSDLKLENGSVMITSPGKDSKFDKNEERIKYDVLIGADGAHSMVRKHLEEWNFIDGNEMDRGAIGIQGDAEPYPELEWGVDLEKFSGIWWIFPHKTYTAVGIGILKSDHDKFDTNAFLKYFNDRGIHISRESVKGHPIVCSSHPRMATGLKDVYLLGEAGGFTKGSSGEGFSGAILSASRLVQRLLSSSRDKKVKVEHADLFPDLVRHVKLSYNERLIGIGAYNTLCSSRTFPFDNANRNLWLGNLLAATGIGVVKNELIRRFITVKKFKKV